MTDYTKPISASNPPESKGNRKPATSTPIVRGGTGKKGVEGEEPQVEQLVDQPTQKAPSPATRKTKTK